jgi:hypothetical protein
MGANLYPEHHSQTAKSQTQLNRKLSFKRLSPLLNLFFRSVSLVIVIQGQPNQSIATDSTPGQFCAG